MENITVYCKTRQAEGLEQVRTKLTLDMSNVTVEDLKAYAVDALVIKWQGSIRRKKDSVIPAEATYIVPKAGTRTAPEMSASQMLIKQFGAERAEKLIEKHGSAEAVVEFLREMLNEDEDEA